MKKEISEKAELKEALKLAKKKMPEFDTVIDLFDMCFVYITAKSAAISGYTPDEMIGKHISSFMTSSDDSEKFRNIITKTMNEDVPVTIPVKTKSGKKMKLNMKFVTIQVGTHPFLVTSATKHT